MWLRVEAMFTELSSLLSITFMSPYSLPLTDAFFDQNTVDWWAAAALAVVNPSVVGVLSQLASDDTPRPLRQNCIGRPGSAAGRPNPRTL
jgi:hypothetical protein